ncbi:MAG: carbohydrate ABC transporter substrate-binding protein [Lachnospiraceae bacterium]|nr:carbohydrate ABC transporter substrate-binding protein [Lachnospiraceae bacterium]
MKAKKAANKLLSILLLCAMLLTLLSGCGAEEEVSENSAENEQNAKSTQSSAEVTAMGRYVEETANLPNEVFRAKLSRLEDESLVICESYSPLYISKDNGVTWETDESITGSGIWENKSWVFDMATGADHTMAIIYDDYEKVYEQGELNPRLCLVKPDGAEVTIDIPVRAEDRNPAGVWISDTGRIFVNTDGSNIYEARENGNMELFLELDPTYHPYLIQCQQNLMVIDGGSYSELLIYDMEKKQYIEDEVLKEFVNENYADRTIEEGYGMYFFLEEQGVIYLAGQEGLHRHVIGGSAMEQVIDGKLTTFNDPSNQVLGMIKLENDDFVTLFSDGRLVRYVYNPDIPTVPNEKLKVYSLENNDTIRQAISLYQIKNPEVWVEYEIGMEDGASVTRDDTLKELNTKIMAGDGPDILVLDKMPLDSYIEKGLLLDMGPILYNLSGEEALFTNIMDAMKTEDKLYVMPIEIQIPVLYGDKQYISKADNLEGIADIVEELRKEYPEEEQDLLGVYSEREIMYLFSMVSTPAWTAENGTIDMGAIAEFLTQVKRIYDAQMDGLTKETTWSHGAYALRGQEYMGGRTTDVMRLFVGETHITGGTVYTDYGFAHLNSVNKVEKYENDEWIPMNGQSSNVFLAKTMVGISAMSVSADKAEDFIRLCFGKENQSYLINGFAVNQAAFDEGFIFDGRQGYTEGTCGMIELIDENGLRVKLDIYWPDEEQIARLKNCIKTADTPYIQDSMLEETVYEAGTEYMWGNISLDEALDTIEKRMALYFAE